MSSEQPPVIFCDAGQSLGVHNGVARIALIRLKPDGEPTAAVELLLPVAQLQTLVKALQQVKS